MALHGRKDAAERNLAGLHRNDQSAPLDCSTEQEVEQQVSANVAREYAARRAAYFDRPRPGVPEAEQQSWEASVSDEAERRAAGRTPRTIEEVRPDLTRPAAKRALRAHARIEKNEGKLEELEHEVAETKQDQLEHFRHHPHPEPLRAKRRDWRLIFMVAFILETLFNVAMWAKWAGILSALRAGVVPWDRVADAALYGFATVAVSFVGAIVLEWALQKLNPGRWALWAAVGSVLVSGLVLLLAIGAIRYASASGASQAQAIGGTLGAAPYALLTVLSTVCAVGAGATAHRRMRELAAQIEKAEQDEQDFARRLKVLEDERQQVRADDLKLAPDAREADDLCTAFEGDIAWLAGLAKQLQAEEAQRVAAACRVFRAAAGMKRLERNHLLVRAVDVVRVEPPSDGIAQRAKKGLKILSVLLVTLLPLGVLNGCAQVRPTSLVIVCDDTGHDPQAACTPGLLGRAFASWSETAVFLPGSRFRVVMSAGSYGEVTTPVDLRIPATWDEGQDERWSELDWRQHGLAVVEKVQPPLDDPAEPAMNLSDTPVALVVAGEGTGVDGVTRLLLASDGLLIHESLNTEKPGAKVSASQVVEAVTRSGHAWDLTVFGGGVQMCGWSNVGITLEQDALRRSLWADLLVAGQVKTAPVAASCADLYPPVAVELVASPSRADSQ